MLYTTGLRIGEALALNIKDFYPQSTRLHIREGKFHKSRWVPLSPSTCATLKNYIHKRQNLMPSVDNAPVFISLRHNRLHCSTVYQTLTNAVSIKEKGMGHVFTIYGTLLPFIAFLSGIAMARISMPDSRCWPPIWAMWMLALHRSIYRLHPNSMSKPINDF
ncbi:MAG: hypothetical protein DRH43_05865 [Deltaproteobacteria bacterium]|nr:MAG: hypothetical protein DRH43_05865 [Deltaproteobacteria bacterium]